MSGYRLALILFKEPILVIKIFAIIFIVPVAVAALYIYAYLYAPTQWSK
jgi:hypothetical protein